MQPNTEYRNGVKQFRDLVNHWRSILYQRKEYGLLDKLYFNSKTPVWGKLK